MKSERVEAIVNAVRGPDILNIGCVGHQLPSTPEETKRWLHQRLATRYPDARILGLDIDQPNVTRMRDMGFAAELGDAHRLGYEACFDTIVLGELIEHLQNPGECLEGCRRALKPGGRIIISTPNVFSTMLALMYLKNFDRAFNAEHVVWFCPQTLRALIERSGLTLTELKFVDDLAPEVVPDLWYRMYAYGWTLVRPLLPEKYRNTMIAVCTAREPSVRRPAATASSIRKNPPPPREESLMSSDSRYEDTVGSQ